MQNRKKYFQKHIEWSNIVTAYYMLCFPVRKTRLETIFRQFVKTASVLPGSVKQT